VLTFIPRKPHDGQSGHRGQRGVTLIELMVTVTLLSILLGLAVPNFRTWINNAKVRTVSDGLQTGLRLAQAEAVRRNRQVVFFLTNSSDCTTGISADANGMHWAIRTVALMAGDPVAAVQCGVVADSAGGVAITGPTAVCFNSMGRQTANATPGVTGATCGLNPGTNMSTYNLSATGGDRALRVVVTLGGQSRMCDPARTLSDANPDGCP
jgi:type IV fimbrial biogenesis protein FimT